MENFHSRLSDESDQDANTPATHLHILLQFILTKGLIDPFLTTMWDHTDGCPNQYRFAYDIYLLTILALEYYIIIDIVVGPPGQGKDVIDIHNARDKQMF